MQIKTGTPVPTARPQAVVPGSGLASPAPTGGDTVALSSGAPADPPALTQARQLLQEAMSLREQVGQEFVANVVARTPEEFKGLLAAAEPVLGETARAMASQGLIPDQYFMLASETRKLAQAAVSAQMRAELREQSKQPADRAAFLREELGYQAQAEILLANFPERSAEVAQQPVQGEDVVSGRAFVSEMLKGLPADQARQIEQAAAFSPLAQAVAANPALVDKAAASLAQTGAAMVAVTQGCGQYMAFLQQAVLPREAQAGQLLASLQPPAQH